MNHLEKIDRQYMDNSLLISKYVQTILEEDPNVIAILGNDSKKIFPLLQPDNLTFPFVVHSRTGIQTEYTKDVEYGNVGFWNRVQFTVSCVSGKYSECIELANAVRHALELYRWKDEDIYIHPIQLVSAAEYTTDNDAFVQELQFQAIVE